jgi:hypothetical protein
MLLLRFAPAAKGVDTDQLDLREAIGVAHGDRRIARAKIVPRGNLLAFAAVQELNSPLPKSRID